MFQKTEFHKFLILTHAGSYPGFPVNQWKPIRIIKDSLEKEIGSNGVKKARCWCLPMSFMPYFSFYGFSWNFSHTRWTCCQSLSTYYHVVKYNTAIKHRRQIMIKMEKKPQTVNPTEVPWLHPKLPSPSSFLIIINYYCYYRRSIIPYPVVIFM